MTGQVRNSNVDHIPGVSGAPLPPDARWQNVQLFAGLDPEATAAIAARLQLHTFAPGDVLIREGRPCGELFILRSGVMQVSRTPDTVDIATIDDDENPALHDVLLRRLVEGDCFGEMSLITGALPSATVRALTDGEAWALGAADFTALASGYPSLARNINIILSERLLYTTRQQSGSPPQHVIVAIAAPSPFLDALARSLSGYSADECSTWTSAPCRRSSSRTHWKTCGAAGFASRRRSRAHSTIPWSACAVRTRRTVLRRRTSQTSSSV